MMRLRTALLGAALMLAPVAAQAQNNYPSVGGATVPTSVAMCLNSSGQAVPLFNAAGTWQCSGATIPISGTVTVDTSLLATSAKQDTTNTDLGPPGATACATDTGSCSVNALLQRLSQRLSTLIVGPLPVTGSGTAGTPAAGVETVQGAASMYPVAVAPSISTLTTGITRPADTNAYAANDAFANSTSAPTAGGFTFTSACRASGGAGIIKDAVVSASAATSYQGEVWIFDQAVTATNDNAALSVSDSDILNLVGVIPFNTNDVNAANAISYVTGLDIGYTCVGTANLRFLVKIMSAVTPGNAEVLTVRVKVQN